LRTLKLNFSIEDSRMDQTAGNNNLPGINEFCGNRDMTDCQEPKDPTAEPKKGNLWKDGAARGVAGL
jgi:hypothetical protein